MNIFVGVKRCSTCQRMEKALKEKGLAYEYREMDAANPSKEELAEWHRRSGLPLARFFNTSGMKYRELGLSEKRGQMSEDEQLELLASDGMLVKRPILLAEDGTVQVGRMVEAWIKER
ncbi:MAG: Spx/MgsR family RNA polymerase-binding regulatory protein [Ndongobacter sp.]|nr:Spx/MgsR family RNA polymerase-binding regulatory protein [Ndongobacter sp.]